MCCHERVERESEAVKREEAVEREVAVEREEEAVVACDGHDRVYDKLYGGGAGKYPCDIKSCSG